MKKSFFLAVALSAMSAVNAQVVSDAISATLKKGDTTTVYYGTDALKTAMDNAADGSIIGFIRSPFKHYQLSQDLWRRL